MRTSKDLAKWYAATAARQLEDAVRIAAKLRKLPKTAQSEVEEYIMWRAQHPTWR